MKTRKYLSRINPDDRFIVISYFTLDTLYEDAVKDLIKSLDSFNISYLIVGIEDWGTWQGNTQYKAKFIKHWLRALNTPVAFIDADAVVRQYPIIFDQMAWDEHRDVAVRYNDKGDAYSGTIFLNPHIYTFNFLELWIEKNIENSYTLEQNNMRDALGELDILITPLPAEYTKIFDEDGECAVIEHMQASRGVYMFNIYKM